MSDLLSINVNSHVEKKNGLSYLSWAWAWAEVLKIDPLAEWEAVEFSGTDGLSLPCMYVGEGSALVKTRVTIKGKTRHCLLPVMDHRNKAIKNPDAFAINTAIMRCMTKAIGMHGLGLYIYAGEDLPEGDGTESLVPALEASIERAKIEQGLRGLKATVGHIHAQKTGVMADVLEHIELTREDREYLDDVAANVQQLFTAQGVGVAFERIEAEGLDNEQKIYLWSQLPSNVRSSLKKQGEARKTKETA